MTPELENLRVLDVDDLILLRLLGLGATQSQVARELRLTPPAIAHRVKKINESVNLFGKEKGKRILNAKGKDFAKAADHALANLCSLSIQGHTLQSE